jgi:hypothetical protein
MTYYPQQQYYQQPQPQYYQQPQPQYYQPQYYQQPQIIYQQPKESGFSKIKRFLTKGFTGFIFKMLIFCLIIYCIWYAIKKWFNDKLNNVKNKFSSFIDKVDIFNIL